jgi:hypothetical protein
LRLDASKTGVESIATGMEHATTSRIKMGSLAQNANVTRASQMTGMTGVEDAKTRCLTTLTAGQVGDSQSNNLNTTVIHYQLRCPHICIKKE